MSGLDPREKEIFLKALEMDSSEERTDYIAGVCGDDQNLFDRVQTLLRANDSAKSFLPTDLKVEEHTIFPREQWSRQIKDLEALLSNENVEPHRPKKKGEKKGIRKTDKEKALEVLALPRFQKPD